LTCQKEKTFRKLFLISAAKGLDNFTGAPDCLWLKFGNRIDDMRRTRALFLRRGLSTPLFDYQSRLTAKAFR
jgi:hypothetical protein